MKFKIIGELKSIETIAVGSAIRELPRLIEKFGNGRWRKLKAIGHILFEDGTRGVVDATLARSSWHWEAQNEDQRLLRLIMDQRKRAAICIDTDGYDESLDLRKAYPVIDDARAERDGMIRVIDETGEDYLFGVDMFIVVTLPPKDAETLNHLIETPAAASH